jgi:hypothetical protein
MLIGLFGLGLFGFGLGLYGFGFRSSVFLPTPRFEPSYRFLAALTSAGVLSPRTLYMS